MVSFLFLLNNLSFTKGGVGSRGGKSKRPMGMKYRYEKSERRQREEGSQIEK